MIPSNSFYNTAQPTSIDFTDAELEVNSLLDIRGINSLNTYERFSPHWHELFNQKAYIIYGITLDYLTQFKDSYTIQDVPRLNLWADKLDKINLCVGKTHLFFLKAINLIDAIKENINSLHDIREPLQKRITSLKNLDHEDGKRTPTISPSLSKKVTFHLNKETHQKSTVKPRKFNFSKEHIIKSSKTPQKKVDWFLEYTKGSNRCTGSIKLLPSSIPALPLPLSPSQMPLPSFSPLTPSQMPLPVSSPTPSQIPLPLLSESS